MRRRMMQAASARRLALGPQEAAPGRPTVEAVRRRYEVGGEKFLEAVREAVELLARETDDLVILESVGFEDTAKAILAEAKMRVAIKTTERAA